MQGKVRFYGNLLNKMSFKNLNILCSVLLMINYMNCSVLHTKKDENKILDKEAKNVAQMINNFLNSRREDSENKMVDTFVAKYVVFGEEPRPCAPDQPFLEYDDTEHEDLKSTESSVDYEVDKLFVNEN